MIINNPRKNLLFVIIPVLFLCGSAPILMAATSWQSLIDESGLELGIKADQLDSLPIEKQQELETKLKLIGAGKSWENGDFEKGAQAFGRIVAISPSSPGIKGIDFLKVALVGTGIKIIIEAPKITLVHFYITNREHGLADTIAWQKAIESPQSSCQLYGISQLNEAIGDVCQLFQNPEKLEALHQSSQFIWVGVDFYRQYQDLEQLKILRQWILSEIEAGQKLQQTIGFFSSLWQAVTHSVKTAYVSVKEFFTGSTSQKDKTAIQPSDLSGQISNALSSGANKGNTLPVQQSSQPKPAPPASSSGGGGSIPQTQQKTSLIKSEFLQNDKIAEQIIDGEHASVDIRSFSDDINLIRKGISNSPELFEYKVISVLRMLGMSRPFLSSSPNFIGEILLNKFQRQHGLPQSPFVDSGILQKIDSELALRERKDKELASRFPLYSRFTESLPNQPTKEHVAALYTLAFESLPAHLVRWGALYFEDFLRTQLRDFIVNPSSNDWKICTGEWFMYGVVSHPCPTKISVQKDQAIVFGDELALIDALLHEYAHFLDKNVGYSHALTIDTDGFNSISFLKDNPEGFMTKSPEKYYKRKPVMFVTEFISDYAANNSHEDFAESFAMYVTQGNVFRELGNQNQYLRQKYDWLKTNVFRGVEYNTGDTKSISAWQGWLDMLDKSHLEQESPFISLPGHPADYSLIISEHIFKYVFPRL